MGVINLTPDSFFENSRAPGIQEAVETAGRMIQEGAEILDLGAMSTRPGAEEINAATELERLIPALWSIRQAFPGTFISVDTYRSQVAREAAGNGADMINDISGGSFDEEMFDAIAELSLPYVLMHTGGKPKTMQDNPVYSNVLEDVRFFFEHNIGILHSKGISQVILDPGFGFGKTIEHNYRLLAGLSVFRIMGHPVMVGVSRKSLINKILNTAPGNALNGTTVLNTIALMNGADILRVHDVKEAVQCRMLVKAYREYG
ncbi:MAG: dihydropteroate synthase, partial [Bacteroidales bacterium]|nr:dihydropteroate synthase [Bacteroidales bacterium]